MSAFGSGTRTRSEFLSVLLMAAIFGACAIGFWGNDATDLPAPLLPATPWAIDDLHPSIGGVIEKADADGALEITLVQNSPKYPASVVTDFLRDALAVSLRLQMFFPDIDNGTVRFVVKAPPEPGIGLAEKAVPLLSLDFDRSELMQMRLGGEFSSQELLNRAVAIHYLAPTGRLYLAAFCRDPVSSLAAGFCRREEV